MITLSRRAALFLMAAFTCPLSAHAAEEPKVPRPTFVPLGDFTINLPDDSPMAYVIVGVTIEVAPEAAGDMNDIAPRLKDLCIGRLMAMAAQGLLAPGHTDLVMVKTSLFDGISRMRPNGVREVLITRLLYG
jgi:flagellar basal body-associated protein FliL